MPNPPYVEIRRNPIEEQHGSTASFLTKDYMAYEAAKNASEALRPATKVLQIHVPSSSSSAGISNESRFNQARSSSSSPFIVQFKGLEQNCCVPPDVQLAAGPTYVMEMVNRYGDYFAASPDPSDESAIWVAGEYHEKSTWSTYMARLHI
jgi:hypothetical protein